MKNVIFGICALVSFSASAECLLGNLYEKADLERELASAIYPHEAALADSVKIKKNRPRMSNFNPFEGWFHPQFNVSYHVWELEVTLPGGRVERYPKCEASYISYRESDHLELACARSIIGSGKKQFSVDLRLLPRCLRPNIFDIFEGRKKNKRG